MYALKNTSFDASCKAQKIDNPQGKKKKRGIFSALAVLTIVFSLFFVSGLPAYAMTDEDAENNLIGLMEAKDIAISAERIFYDDTNKVNTMADLSPREYLEAMVEIANEEDSENYTTDRWDVLQDQIDASEILLANSSASDDDLTDAADKLYFAVFILPEFDWLIDGVGTLNLENCTDGIRETFETALSNAQTLQDDPYWKFDEVGAALDELWRAEYLVFVDWDINWAEWLINFGSDSFSDATWEMLNSAYDDASAVLGYYETATWDEVYNADDALYYADYYADTEFYVNYAQYLDSSDYSKSDWKTFNTALNAAKKVLAKDNPALEDLQKVNKNLYDAYYDIIFVLDDVWPTDWYYDAVMFLYNNGLISGYEDGTFQPYQDVDKEVAYWIAWALDKDIDAEGYDPTTDPDVLTYYPDNEFSNSQEDCIYALFTLLVGVDVSDVDTSVLDEFADGGDVSDTCKPVMAYLVNAGLLNGDGDSYLYPQETLTRAQFAYLVYYFIGFYVGPEITTQPADMTVNVGETVSLSVAATGEGKLTYQWYYNTTDSYENSGLINKATKATYSFKSATAGTAYYYCIVTDTISGEAYTTTSDFAEVVVKALTNAEAPTITLQPLGTTAIYVGNTYNMTIAVSDLVTGELSYQWYSNTKNTDKGKAIKGATATTYTVPTTKAGTTYYYCIVTNTDDTMTGQKTAIATSNIVLVTVNAVTNAEAPKITTQPANTTVDVGGDVILSVVATGTGTLTYQWYSATDSSTKKGTAIEEEATESTYDVPTDAASMLFYYCVVTNTDDNVLGTKTATTTSKAAKVTVKALTNATAPVIKTQPANVTAYLNYSAKLSIKATGKTLSYQWYSNTTNSTTDAALIADATSASYNAPTSVEGIIYYYCVVTSTDSSATGVPTASVTSNIVSVTVNPVTDADPPIITLQPTVSPVNVGEMVNLSVTATGTKLTYQWYSNTTDSNSGGDPIKKATKASYSFKSTTVGTFYYYCVITNTDKSVLGNKTATTTSEAATVVVNALTNAEKPNISGQSGNMTVNVAGTATLSVTATPLETGELSYQWYSNTKENTKGKAIKGATSATYSAPTTKVGTTYYYCIVTNTDDTKTGQKTAAVYSSIIKVIVTTEQLG